MKYQTICYENINVQIAEFCPQSNQNIEYQVLFNLTDTLLTFEQQCRALVNTVNAFGQESQYHRAFAVFGRCFLSDPANQQRSIQKMLDATLRCAISFVGQTPLNGGKLALWLQMQTEGVCGVDGGIPFCEHNGYRHYRTSAYGIEAENSFAQTYRLFADTEIQLNKRSCLLAKNCMRTWLFVRDIDANYQGVVDARREFFEKHGLTVDTHFIASTGIEGKGEKPTTKVILDTHCIQGISQEQIHYLYAKENLNSTYEYGVTFERGMYMDYGDRRQVYISGTASIDNRGGILHLGDAVGQSLRAFENVEALLKEADCTFSDVSMMIVYVRDVNDYPAVKAELDKRFPNIPKQIVLAPVCRPQWLVEMECMATKGIINESLENF